MFANGGEFAPGLEAEVNRALLIVFIVAVSLAAAGCGGKAVPLHVTSLKLSGVTGFTGSPTVFTFDHGQSFRRAARLVPLPLPPVAAAHPRIVCFPMDLTIGLSNGQKLVYPSCYRPRSLRPVVAAL